MSRCVLIAGLVLAVGMAGCTDTAVEETAGASSGAQTSGPATTSTSSPLPSDQPTACCATQFQPALGVFGLDAPLLPDGLDGWVLLLGGAPLQVGESVKVIWKVGSGNEPGMVGIGPSGEEIEPDFMNQQGGSNWDRPGELEWGTGWTFPHAGCWELRVTRGNGSASVEVPVA